MGTEAETANVQMYDDFLRFVQKSDVSNALSQLRWIAQNNHKPAFERCASKPSPDMNRLGQ